MPEVIQTKLVSQYYNNLLARYFGINKIREFINQNYYWPSFKNGVETHGNNCNICLA